MANCPKCNAHLKMTDWRQHCPHCGANIVVYDLQERLMQEADKAEVQHYHFQKKIDRVKASFVGSKLAIVRIFTCILPVCALLLPLVNAVCSSPFKPYDGGISALTIYNNFDQLNGDTLSALLSGSLKNSSMYLLASAGLLVLSLLFTVIHLIFLALSCSPKGKQRNYVIDAIILIFSIGSAVCFAAITAPAAVSGSLGIGAYLYILLQLVNVGVDVAVFKQGIEITHKPCVVGGIPIEEYFEMEKSGMPREEIRAEQYKRLQALADEKEAKLKEEEAAKVAAEAEKLAAGEAENK